jgi:hypothetical protein
MRSALHRFYPLARTDSHTIRKSELSSHVMPTGAEDFHARFNPLIKPFLVLKTGATMLMTIVGIALAIIWFLGVGRWWSRHYLDHLACHLSERSLR